MTDELRYPINLLQSGDVVARDGEFLGTWATDDSDAIYQFTPDGESAPTMQHPFMAALCRQIAAWHSDN